MSSVHCPYCHSEQVILRESQPNGPQYFEKILDTFSPPVMAALGIKFAKEAGIPPYIGGLIGVVVGGTLVLVSQHYFYRHYKSAQHYRCLQCGQDFAVAA
jgi:DNA-directed RNA polymerase subunit RPC12/RpoP